MNFIGKAAPSKSVSDKTLNELNLIKSLSTLKDQQIRVRNHIESTNNCASNGISKINMPAVQTQFESELSLDSFLTDKTYHSNICQDSEETLEKDISADISIINCMETSIVPQLSELKASKEEPEYVCQICNKTFKTTSNLNVHVRIHSAERKFVCSNCPKSYKYSTQLINHKRLHTGEKPFGCYHKNCQKTFAQLGQLKKHVRVHTGERPYECTVCSKRFTRGYHLQTHRKLHTKAALHVCHLCEKSYTQAPQLRIHMTTHSTTKDFNCSVCQKSFHKISVRNKHMQIHVKNHVK